MTHLNEELAKQQAITPKQRKKLQRLYTKLDALMVAAGNSPDSDKPKLASKLVKLEYKLQKNWNFPQDAAYHKYQFRLPGCTCSTLDNDELRGIDMKYVTVGCPYHDPKPTHKSIMIADGVYTQLKSKSTKSVDIHLYEDNQYVNVILPNGTILVVEPDGTVTQFSADTLIDEHRFV